MRLRRRVIPSARDLRGRERLDERERGARRQRKGILRGRGGMVALREQARKAICESPRSSSELASQLMLAGGRERSRSQRRTRARLERRQELRARSAARASSTRSSIAARPGGTRISNASNNDRRAPPPRALDTARACADRARSGSGPVAPSGRVVLGTPPRETARGGARPGGGSLEPRRCGSRRSALRGSTTGCTGASWSAASR